MKSPSSYLFCCDWGTTSFRLSLIDRVTGEVLQEITTREGTFTIFGQWEATKSFSPEHRFVFYLEIIRKHINSLSKLENKDLSGVPIIISGMASSSIGILELPYANTPFNLDGSDVIAKRCIDSFDREIVLVSGMRTKTDVMRGEEVQLIGMERMISEFEKVRSKIIVLLPGTHSKHVYIQNNKVSDFATFLTGEIFEHLNTFGLLKQSIVRSTETEFFENREYFRRGVQHACKKPLLQSLFSVRTNQLFELVPPKGNYYYMSGLLIGSELKELLTTNSSQIILCCPDHLSSLYENAIDELGLTSRTFIESADRLNQYLIEAHMKIANRYLH